MTKNMWLRIALTALVLLASKLAFSQAGSLGDILWGSSTNSFGDEQPIAEGSDASEYFYPAGLISLPENTKYLIWTELKEGRLNLLEQLSKKKFRLLKTIPISIGKLGYGKEIEGDKRTPIGVYRVTRYIPEEELTDFYGLGAYPINYPNTWDKLQKRTGYGIWLHGLPKGVEQRPLLDSDGCVVVDNQSLTFLDNYITPEETIVVLANELDWVSKDPVDEENSLIRAIDAWEQSWESLDSDAYLAHYHPEFTDFRRDLSEWKEYKTGINTQKTFIEVAINDLSAIRYPGTEGLFSVRFYQTYKSSNYNWAGWKELLWQRDAQGRWKILFEGNG